MSRINTLNAKRAVAVFIAVVMMILSLSYTDNNQVDVAAASKTRTYWRHDYSSTNLSSHYEYTLTLDSTNNARTIFKPNDMVRDYYDTAVVRIDGPDATGFIVDDHIIATAAHCVYDLSSKKFYDFTISIIDENNNVIKTISPKYAHINKKFSEFSSYIDDSKRPDYTSMYDYAMIYVNEDLSEYGQFNLGVALDSYVNNQGSVIVSGFPIQYPDGYSNADWGIRFKAAGNIMIQHTTSKLLRYNADMTNGDSGGPVYLEEGIVVNGKLKQYKTVIAINVCQDLYCNTGVRMTGEILKFYGDNPYKTK